MIQQSKMIRLGPMVYIKFAAMLSACIGAGALYYLVALPWMATQFGYTI